MKHEKSELNSSLDSSEAVASSVVSIGDGKAVRRTVLSVYEAGRITLSITWMTPLLDSMSVATTVAPSIMTRPSAI